MEVLLAIGLDPLQRREQPEASKTTGRLFPLSRTSPPLVRFLFLHITIERNILLTTHYSLPTIHNVFPSATLEYLKKTISWG